MKPTHKTTAVAQKQSRHVLFQTWSDVPPEMLGVLVGTDEEVAAWCAGFNYAVAHPHELQTGNAATLPEIMADPKGHGMTGDTLLGEG